MDRSRILWHGLVAGLIGYATVVVLVAALNAISGRSPFYTAALLGSAMFYSARTLAEVTVAPGPVLAYNGLHLILFLGLGVFLSFLTELAQRGPHLWYVGIVFYIFAGFHVVALAIPLPELLRAAVLNGATIAVGMVASLAMGLYLLWTHPRLRAEMREFGAQDQDLADEPR